MCDLFWTAVRLPTSRPQEFFVGKRRWNERKAIWREQSEEDYGF